MDAEHAEQRAAERETKRQERETERQERETKRQERETERQERETERQEREAERNDARAQRDAVIVAAINAGRTTHSIRVEFGAGRARIDRVRNTYFTAEQLEAASAAHEAERAQRDATKDAEIAAARDAGTPLKAIQRAFNVGAKRARNAGRSEGTQS
ncbi:hypothetical protein [Microbacterium sp. A94]|uniref:hypothetical protein n=1 Tax=Microbacterium sp. A94 TaxID=3450717 RepID=UPI003F42A5C6